MYPEADGSRFLQNTRINLTNYGYHIPEDCNLDTGCHESVKSHIVPMFTGNPKPHITWEKDGDKIDHSDRWSLKLENLSVHDIGNYTCFVCNSLACINFVFEVNVIGTFLSVQDN
jgi:hypothetical protein